MNLLTDLANRPDLSQTAALNGWYQSLTDEERAGALTALRDEAWPAGQLLEVFIKHGCSPHVEESAFRKWRMGKKR